MSSRSHEKSAGSAASALESADTTCATNVSSGMVILEAPARGGCRFEICGTNIGNSQVPLNQRLANRIPAIHSFDRRTTGRAEGLPHVTVGKHADDRVGECARII